MLSALTRNIATQSHLFPRADALTDRTASQQSYAAQQHQSSSMNSTPMEDTYSSTDLHRQRRLAAGRSGGIFECREKDGIITHQYIRPTPSIRLPVDPLAPKDDDLAESSQVTDDESEVFSCASSGHDTSTLETEINETNMENQNKDARSHSLSMEGKRDKAVNAVKMMNRLIVQMLLKVEKRREVAKEGVAIGVEPLTPKNQQLPPKSDGGKAGELELKRTRDPECDKWD